MSKRMQEWAEAQCEKIAESEGPGARCEAICIRGQDVLYRLESAGGAWTGWLYEGESISDIQWQDA